MSTAYHPQTNGQTEVVNKVITQTLKAYVRADQTDWDLSIPNVEFAYNTALHSATGMTPFFLNYGKQPYVPSTLFQPPPSNHPAVSEFIQQLQQSTQQARQQIIKAQHRAQHTANSKRREQQHSIGDRVLLSNDHLPVPGQGLTRKLREIWSGPYRITHKVGPLNYRLELPPSMRVHPVFHVSRLRAYVGPQDLFPHRPSQPVPPIVIDGEHEYEVECNDLGILGYVCMRSTTHVG